MTRTEEWRVRTIDAMGAPVDALMRVLDVLHGDFRRKVRLEIYACVAWLAVGVPAIMSDADVVDNWGTAVHVVGDVFDWHAGGNDGEDDNEEDVEEADDEEDA